VSGADPFTEEQKQYLHGFVAGSGLAQLPGTVPTFAATLGIEPGRPGQDVPSGEEVPPGPEAVHYRAQDRQVAAGGKLTPEEQAKRKRFPLDQWDDLCRHATEGRFPKGTDVLAFKYQGLFHTAPAQDAYMCRLRFPGGIVPTFQARVVANVAELYGGGYADVTTRANFQLREIRAADAVAVVEALHGAGVVNRGAGADNVRNVTGSPTAGIDPQELIDTRPLSRAIHHYILNHRELYGLPRKFNIAFDGGGAVSSVEDTNDIGFAAVRVGEGTTDEEGNPVPPGVYFRMALGGITGHKDFARDAGVLLAPDECVPVAAAALRVFIEHGDRTDRRKARLKYVLDARGIDWYVKETEAALGRTLRRLKAEDCEPRPPVAKHGHLGFHPQRQPGLYYAGVLLPVGRLTSSQLRGLADLADRHGGGTLRLTVWQNLLISDVPEAKRDVVRDEILRLGLHCDASNVRGGLVACTGAAGCKYAMAHTKQHAAQLADYLDPRVPLDAPVNIHFTGCPHSCAQHYMGDIGLLGTRMEAGEEMAEAYHVFVGGGYGAEQGIGRELFRNILAPELPGVVERLLLAYLENRATPAETFREFTGRLPVDRLRQLSDQPAAIG
jgi:ferredoxin-nitrite reductase